MGADRVEGQMEMEVKEGRNEKGVHEREGV